MEVTKDNFEDVLEEVLKDIDVCSFVSVDTELSGLWRNGEPDSLGPQDEYYNLFLNSASDFICTQIGFTFFTFSSENKKYKAKTYNFYVFPRQFSRSSAYSFSFQANSIEFLVSHNFDFNKVFYKGIPYLNLEREAELSEMLEERRFFKEKNASREMESLEVPEEHRKSVQETCDTLSTVLEMEGHEEVKVPGLNAYIRRLVYQSVKQRYPNGELLVDTRDGVMVGRRGKVDGFEPKSQVEIDEESIAKAVGFSKVIRALSKSGKMIVGHNMFLDICHIVNNFLCNMPKNYSEFKGLIKGVFPLFLDTKFMTCSEGLRDLISNSTLNRLYSRISESPFSKPDIEYVEGYSYKDAVEKYHDAGFDSYITGVVFIAVYNYIASSKNSSGNIEFNPKSEKIKRYINRIYMNNSPDNHFFLSGTDPEPDRSHYFHVCFPRDWTSKDIINIFSPYSRININWINDESAWVSVNDKSQIPAVTAGLCSRNSRYSEGAIVSPYSLSKYRSVSAARKRPAESSQTHQHSPYPKRRKSSYDSSLTSRNSFETIPEVQEEGSPYSWSNKKFRFSDTPGDSKQKPVEHFKQDHRTPNSNSRRQLLTGYTPNRSQSSHKLKYSPIISESPSSSSSSNGDSVIAELEKDLDSDRSKKPFSTNSNWDVA